MLAPNPQNRTKAPTNEPLPAPPGATRIGNRAKNAEPIGGARRGPHRRNLARGIGGARKAKNIAVGKSTLLLFFPCRAADVRQHRCRERRPLRKALLKMILGASSVLRFGGADAGAIAPPLFLLCALALPFYFFLQLHPGTKITPAGSRRHMAIAPQAQFLAICIT